jgi:hypothetical protein
MSTLAVVEEILREVAVPMSVREIVERAGARLPSKSKTPDTVVARDLSMDIKRKGDSSAFVRSSPGRYTLRALMLAHDPELRAAEPSSTSLSSALRAERVAPMAARRHLLSGSAVSGSAASGSVAGVASSATAAPSIGPPSSTSSGVSKDGFAG